MCFQDNHMATSSLRTLSGLLIVWMALLVSGCTSTGRWIHMYSDSAPKPETFKYLDGGSSVYYSFSLGNAASVESAIFFYGGSGCPSWKSVMPGYAHGLSTSAKVFALNKRFVPDRSAGLFGCGANFHQANNPKQWVADYSEFISAQLKSITPRPRHVVLVGVSEGAIPAVKVASHLPDVTTLVIIGSGGYSMRESLTTLKSKGAIGFDVNEDWKKISNQPRSIEDSWYGNTHRWWTDIMDIQPANDYLQLRIPIYLAMGEQDQSVPMESALFLADRFKAAGKQNLHVRFYAGADHRLVSNGKSHRIEFFSELSQSLLAK